MVAAELKTRETSHASALKNAAQMEKGGDADAAAELYRQVAGDGCLFPSLAKKATKALDRMGKSAPTSRPPAFPMRTHRRPTSARG